ncbi:Pectate lyase superfamily protein [compost metagenome]
MTFKKNKRNLWIIACIFVFLVAAVSVLYIFRGFTSHTLNVKEAGAKGDGIHDDTAAFMKVLKYAADLKSRNEVHVIVPPGTYLIDVKESLPLLSNVHIQGIDYPVLKFAPLSTEQHGYEAFMISGHNIGIEGIVIDGSNRLIRGVGIHTGSSRVQINNSMIQRISQGDDPDSPFYSAVVSGIMIYGRTHDITISASKIRDIKAIHDQPVSRGIMVLYEDGEPIAKRIRISANEISHIAPKEDADGIFFDTAPPNSPLSESVIENNAIHHSAKRGIKIAAPGVTIRNNRITNSFSGNNPYLFPATAPIPQDMYSAISVYASHVTLSGNVINGIGSFYSAIEVDSGPLSHITIQGNDISVKAGDRTRSNRAKSTGIRLGDISQYQIINNKISNVETAIRLAESSEDTEGKINENQFDNVDIIIQYLDQ